MLTVGRLMVFKRDIESFPCGFQLSACSAGFLKLPGERLVLV